MTTEQYMNMIRNNPYVIGRIENPTEEMQLLAVQLNGQALQYITNTSPAVQEAAIANTARAIQFIENPSEDIKLQAVRAGWNNLSYLDNPSQELIDAALDQSGWAIKYIKDADHDLQLRAVNKNYDAVKYIKDPAPDVQLAAVRGNYEALRYIENPTDEAKDLAIREDAQALRLIRNLGKEDFLHYLGLNVLVSKYIPKDISLSPDDWRDTLKDILAQEDVSEEYVRNFITCSAVDLSPVDKILLVDDYGSQKARRITVDEKLTLK